MTRFLVVVPFYDVPVEWLDRCLRSIEKQDWPEFDVQLIDDHSVVGNRYAADVARQKSWGYFRTLENRKAPHTLRLGVDAAAPEPDTVILIVDGDDYLPHSGVLRRFAETYEDPGVWLAWAEYTRVPDPTFMPNPSLPYPEPVIATNSYRAHNVCCFNHPLTFRKHLWDRVTDADLKDNDGRWFRASYDAAIMFPMLELAGTHQRFIPEVAYVYNEANPASEAKTIPAENARVHQILRARPPKDPV